MQVTEKQIEAAARAIMLDDICGLIVAGKRVLCDDESAYDDDALVCLCRRQARAAIKAMQAPVVKPLEWGYVTVPGGWMPETYQADTVCGLYQVFAYDDSAVGAVFAEWANDSAHFGMKQARSIARVHDFDAAKAAAQADFERRILSALEPSEC